MIEIKNLTKIFKSKKNQKCIALNNINFNLENTGFVFITGKSGSGKTTLLSLIGGLDEFSSGDIVVDGIKLSKLKGKYFDYYRNEKIGFIFQDYQLFDELTVYENIKLALNFINDKDYSKIDKALEDVDLKGYGDRYPNELSGGEKQRVAIARVLVKNPSIILADEPTGNLDSNTTKTILKILKNISKNRLVLIVSHNIYDAHEFADYILELSYGNLVGTYKRNEKNNKTIEINEGELRLPLHKIIKEEDKKDIINSLKNVNSIVQDDKDFVPVDLTTINNKKTTKINKRHISLIEAYKRGFSFLKNGLAPMFIFSIIVSILFGIINTSFSLVKIDEKQILLNDIKEYDRPYLTLMDKYALSFDYIGEIRKEQLDQINDSYSGKKIERYCTSFTTSRSNDYGELHDVVICDSDFIKKQYGEFNLLYEADEYKEYGVYVTDFFIDYLNNLTKLNSKEPKNYLKHGYRNSIYINGIIDTGYKEKYEKFLPILFSEDFNIYDLNKKLYKSDKKLYEDFTYDLNTSYYSAITFNPDFIDIYYLNGPVEAREIGLNYYYNGEKIYSSNLATGHVDILNKPCISKKLYSMLTGKKIDSTEKYVQVEPITFKLQLNYLHSKGVQKEIIPLTFDTVITRNNSSDLNINPNIQHDLYKKIFFTPTGITLENNNLNKALFENNELIDYIVLNDLAEVNAKIIAKIQIVIKKIFTIMAIALLFCCFIALIFYGIYLVKKNMRLLGICKSLGARSIDLLIILACNLLFTILLTIFLYVSTSFIFLNIINRILLTSIVNSTSLFINPNLQLLFINPIFYILNIIFIVVLSVLSFLTLFIKINKLKPINLIKEQ